MRDLVLKITPVAQVHSPMVVEHPHRGLQIAESILINASNLLIRHGLPHDELVQLLSRRILIHLEHSR